MIIMFQPNLLYLRHFDFLELFFDKDGEIGRRSHPSLSRINFKKRRAKKAGTCYGVHIEHDILGRVAGS